MWATTLFSSLIPFSLIYFELLIVGEVDKIRNYNEMERWKKKHKISV